MDGTLSFTVDHDDGYVVISGGGMWSPAQADEHFRELDRAILKLRREHKQLRVLVDLREASVQTPETVAVMRNWTGRIYRDADRVAVVCATALLALQIKRATDIETRATFHDMATAEAWLGPRRKR